MGRSTKQDSIRQEQKRAAQELKKAEAKKEKARKRALEIAHKLKNFELLEPRRE